MVRATCNVFKGMCGAYNPSTKGCDMYECTAHLWTDEKLEDRIKNCDHRKRLEYLHQLIDLAKEAERDDLY